MFAAAQAESLVEVITRDMRGRVIPAANSVTRYVKRWPTLSRTSRRKWKATLHR